MLQESKCTKKTIEQVRLLIERGMSWPAIAEVVVVNKKTLERWKNSDSSQYNADFAAMVAKAEEDFGSIKTKKGQLVQSVRHILCMSELRTEGPKRPRADYTKEMLYWYASEVLGLDLAPGMDKKECLYHIDREIEEQTTTEMVVVREQQVDPSQAAVKNVLKNTGDDKKRWTFEDEHKVGLSDPLTDLIKEIGVIKNVLPSEEEN